MSKNSLHTFLVILLVYISSILGYAKELYTVHINAPDLEAAFQEITKVTGYKFIYYNNDIKGITDVKYQAVAKPIEEIIENLLQATPLTSTIIKKTVIIKPKPQVKKKIEGNVVDDKTEEPLVGVTITIKGTTRGTITDVHGNFFLEVDEGDNILVFSYIGYQQQEISLSTQTFLRVRLNPDITQLQEVMVEARRVTDNDRVLLKEKQEATVLVDAISAQSIERSASFTTDQVLAKMPGVTIREGGAIAIRGLSDRSIVTQLNGARLSSSSTSRTTTFVDLIPSSLLDNAMVFKTLTPDRPADATAGIIELKTKSVPEEEVISLHFQAGYNSSIGYRGEVASVPGTSLGFLGNSLEDKTLDSRHINLPSLYPESPSYIIANMYASPEMYEKAQHINAILEQLDPRMEAAKKTAAPNIIGSLFYGNKYKVLNDRELGVVVGLNYVNKTTAVRSGANNRYSVEQGAATGDDPLSGPDLVTPNNVRLLKNISLTEESGTSQVIYGGMASLTLRLNSNHDFSVNYLNNSGVESGATQLTGKYNTYELDDNIRSDQHILRESKRSFHLGQLKGENRFFLARKALQLSWSASIASSTQFDPDYRITNIATNEERLGYSDYETRVNYPVPGGNNNRSFRDLKETNGNYKVDVQYPVTLFTKTFNFKTGVSYLHRERDYFEYFTPVTGGTEKEDIGIIEDGETTEGGAARVGYLYPISKSLINHTASQVQMGYYAMADVELTSKLRIIGGVRFERAEMELLLDSTSAEFKTAYPHQRVRDSLSFSYYKENIRPYWSASAVYKVLKNLDLRLAFSQTVVRPNLNEIMSLGAFDPFLQAMVRGNQFIRPARANNYDIRGEWYINDRSFFSLTGFYKALQNNIEKAYSMSGVDNSGADNLAYGIVSVFNNKNRGKVYGVEMELSVGLEKIKPALRNFSAGINLMLAHSESRKDSARIAISRIVDRTISEYGPVFEQPPYSFNANFAYESDKTGTSISVFYNIVGSRLIEVQSILGTPDIYELPMPQLDVIVKQRVFKNIFFKGFVKNILGSEYKSVYAVPGSTTYGVNQREYVRRAYNPGREISLGISMSF